MPHVAFVAFTGFRVREPEMLALGMALPGLRRRGEAIGQLPALGLLTLAGMTPAAWSCAYHDTPSGDETFAEQIIAERPDLIAVSALTASIEPAYRFCDQMREAGLHVVLGGLHATAFPQEAGRHVDAVVVGEGEPVWRQVLDDALAHCLRPQYQASAAFDLAQAPIPRFELLGTRPRPRFTVQTQRGCPLACEFCGASRLLGSFREKPVANLQRELAALNLLQPEPVLELADDNTFAGTRPMGPLLEVLGQANARYFTEADWRIGEQPEVLRGLAASGCIQVLVGLESLVYRTPGMGAKRADWSRIRDALLAIQGAGVAVIGCFVAGCDGETPASLDHLAGVIEDSPLADVQITLQTPFPGTPLRRRLAREGRLLKDRDWSAYTLFDATYQPDLMTVAELEFGFRDLVMRVFSPGPTSRRFEIRKNIWQGNPAMRGRAKMRTYL